MGSTIDRPAIATVELGSAVAAAVRHIEVAAAAAMAEPGRIEVVSADEQSIGAGVVKHTAAAADTEVAAIGVAGISSTEREFRREKMA